MASTLFGAPVSYANTYTNVTSITVDITGVSHICGSTNSPDFATSGGHGARASEP
jgi:hypothetical protein